MQALLTVQDYYLPSPLIQISAPWLNEKNITLIVKREDLIHPWLSGNKYRKLKYNLLKAQSEGKKEILTFGGAFSNHIHATAGAGKLFGFSTIGIIRGEIDEDNPTIRFCRQMGMHLIPVSRHDYRLKEASPEVGAILEEYQDAYIVPEGGTNLLALEGVQEMVTELYSQMEAGPDTIILPCGTGGTSAGILVHPEVQSNVLTFSSLKSDHLYDEILSLAQYRNKHLLTVNTDYHFGGYGKWDQSLLDFMVQFESDYLIPLDHVYNAKALFGLFDLIKKDFFAPGATIVYIHTGGLQGREGLEYIRKKETKR
ncbi:MAG: 1-aminocyclopropane-1-carboxylate deaminase/D-cysteine desulfhydrase [Saprospiraceae bacterium]|jgi:1-aminocyclopropane-1-carboxylate deaminase|nr:1-aminocyclopropane-1-carboxylate deaminase/D-cysteine desulfhydrase [Saprospiraceae bacterium]